MEKTFVWETPGKPTILVDGPLPGEFAKDHLAFPYEKSLLFQCFTISLAQPPPITAVSLGNKKLLRR